MTNPQLHEADMVKAVERGRAVMTPSLGDPAGYTWKRKRSIWRAMKRGDFNVLTRVQLELMTMRSWRTAWQNMYADPNCPPGTFYCMTGLSEMLKKKDRQDDEA